MQMFVMRGIAGDDEREEYVIFARDAARASNMSAQFWLHRDELPVQWAGEDWEVYRLFGTGDQLEAAFALDEEGLGIFDELIGWRILPPFDPVISIG